MSTCVASPLAINLQAREPVLRLRNSRSIILSAAVAERPPRRKGVASSDTGFKLKALLSFFTRTIKL